MSSDTEKSRSKVKRMPHFTSGRDGNKALSPPHENQDPFNDAERFEEPRMRMPHATSGRDGSECLAPPDMPVGEGAGKPPCGEQSERKLC